MISSMLWKNPARLTEWTYHRLKIDEQSQYGTVFDPEFLTRCLTSKNLVDNN